MTATPSTAKSPGLAACIAVVVGNMVSSGLYISSENLSVFNPSGESLLAASAALAVGLVAARNVGSGRAGKTPRISAVEIIAFLFSMFTVYVWQRQRVLSASIS